MRRLILAGAALATFSVVCVAASGGTRDGVAAGDWPGHGRDPFEQRFSPLKQITAENVGKLGLAWHADLTERGQWQTTPVVVGGRIYITTPWSKVYAFDARTGSQLWRYDPKVPRELAASSLCCNNSNRGVTFWKGKIIWGTLDGRLVAIDAKKGTKVWETQTTDPQQAMSITGAPRVGNGIVFIGQAGSEFHQRGFLSAYDANTGKKLWHWWTVPGNPAKGFEQPELEWAAKTWNGEWWKTGGGGTPWDGIVYDPVTNLVIFGTGNGAPWPSEVRSPGGGDNLFTSSIVALDAKTGKYRWHYQAVPADNFDFDNTSPLTVADLVIDGQKKHVVMQVPKDGVFYVIEAGTGKVISAQLVVPYANWLTGFDKANNWKPILNPVTGLMYVGIRYATYGMVSEAGAKMGNQLLSINIAKRPEAAAPKLEGAGGWLAAWDPVTQKEKWRARDGNASAGTMTTAGNLVFQGTAPRNLTAFRADTGEKVWTADAGVSISAGSVSYQIGDTQYIAAVGAGGGANLSRLVVYKLGGTETLPPPAPPAAPQAFNPPANFGDAAQLARGQALYTQNCTICHEGGRGIGGIPDLRTTPMMQNAALFKAVVIDGALTDNGMLPFNKVLSADDAEAIRAHVVTLANDLKANPQRGFGGFGPPPAAPRAPGAPAPTPPPEQPAAGLHQ